MKWVYCLATSIALANSWAANAHDFWIEPNESVIDLGETISVKAKTGHGVDQSNWPIVPHRITSLRSIGVNGAKDHQPAIRDAIETSQLVFSDLPEGTHILAIESGNSYSELPAEKFMSYVQEEGITPIARDRDLDTKANEPGKELYSRRGKTLVQVGAEIEPSTHLTQPIGMTLEITPQQNPFLLSPGSAMQVQVRYRGRPIDGATIHVTKLDDSGISTTLLTSSNGIAEMPDMSTGRWLFHTVWSSPAAGLLNGADYITVFSSLTFDIGEFAER